MSAPDLVRKMYKALWALAFPEKIAAAGARYRAAYPGKDAARCREYRRLYPERRRESCARYRVTHPDVINAATARRRALRRGVAAGSCVKIYNKAILWRSLGFDVQVDHITPLSKGGGHSPENLQIIYADDNLRKGAHQEFLLKAVFS